MVVARSLLNALRDLVSLEPWSGLGLGSGLGQKFANCTCAISKLRSGFRELRRVIRVQRSYPNLYFILLYLSVIYVLSDLLV